MLLFEPAALELQMQGKGVAVGEGSSSVERIRIPSCAAACVMCASVHRSKCTGKFQPVHLPMTSRAQSSKEHPIETPS